MYKYKCQLIKEDNFPYNVKCTDPESVYKFFRTIELDKCSEEYLYLLTFDAKGNVIGLHEISHGDVSTSTCNPREIFKRALLNNAYGIILAHNHPSGDPTPSSDDISVTERLKESANILGIKLLDHIIVGDCRYKSMHEMEII